MFSDHLGVHPKNCILNFVPEQLAGFRAQFRPRSRARTGTCVGVGRVPGSLAFTGLSPILHTQWELSICTTTRGIGMRTRTSPRPGCRLACRGEALPRRRADGTNSGHSGCTGVEGNLSASGYHPATLSDVGGCRTEAPPSFHGARVCLLSALLTGLLCLGVWAAGSAAW